MPQLLIEISSSEVAALALLTAWCWLAKGRGEKKEIKLHKGAGGQQKQSAVAQQEPAGMRGEVIAPRPAPAGQHLSQHHAKRTAEQGTAGRWGTAQQGDEMPRFKAALWRCHYICSTNVTLKKPKNIWIYLRAHA